VPHGFLYVESATPLDGVVLGTAGLRLHRQGRAGAVHFHLLQRDIRAAS
jgi:hypothetical protein